MKKNYQQKLIKSAEEMIISDGITLMRLFLNTKYLGIVSLSVLPFVGLYCREAQEFFGMKCLDSIADEQVSDLRNTIKSICKRYNSAEKTVLEFDNLQDEYFRDKVKIDVLKKMNVHYNLGVYFNGDGQVIGNTQLFYRYLYSGNVTFENANAKSFEFGQRLGRATERVLQVTKHSQIWKTIRPAKDIMIGYIDYNTNVLGELFVHPEDKGLSLVLLHMLGMLGTCKYVLREIFGKRICGNADANMLFHIVYGVD